MPEDLFEELRKDMVEYQLRQRGIADQRVLDAFLRIPRHEFVPSNYVEAAYEDHPLQIGEGQTISQPYMVALMTELLAPKPTDKVLELGTGSGYQAAILSRLVKEVYTIERHPFLAEQAKQVLRKLRFRNVEVIIGDATKGYRQAAPFDSIILTAYTRQVPEQLWEQLKEGGIMVIPLGTAAHQVLYKIAKRNGRMDKDPVCEVMFVPVVEDEK